MTSSLKLLRESFDMEHHHGSAHAATASPASAVIHSSPGVSSLTVEDDGGLKRSSTVFGEKYRAYARQHYGDEKISPRVYCKVKIYRLTNLDLIDMTVTVDFCLMLDWIDESIIGEQFPDLEGAHFSPYVRIHNAKEELVKPVDSAFNRLQEKPKYPGHVKRTERYRCTLYITDLNLSKYPFDKHDLKIILKGDHVSLYSVDCKDKSDSSTAVVALPFRDVPLVCPRKDCNHSIAEVDNSHLTGWSMIGFTKQDELNRKNTGDTLQISLTVKRNPFGLVMILIVPLVICIILSLTSFVLDSESLSERLQITVTMLLAAAAFHQQARGHVPPNLPYTTVLDKYMLGTLVILLLQALIHVLIAFVKETDGDNKSVSSLETLLSCRLISHEMDNSILSQYETKSHRLSFFATLFLMISTYHIYVRSGSVKGVYDTVLATITALLSCVGTIVKWFAGGVFIVSLMALGCHTVSINDINSLVMNLGVSTQLCSYAIFTCLQGNCNGRGNPYICSKEVIGILEAVLHDEFLFEIMVFAIVFVHLVLWVEYIN